MKASGLRGLDRFGPDRTAQDLLATCHPSGYVREAALRAVAVLEDGTELPFLVLRLNDWVVPVRRLAAELAVQRATPSRAHQLVSVLPLLLRLRSLGREDHGPVLGTMLAALRFPEAREALLRALQSEDRALRCAAFTVAMETQGMDPERLLRAGLADPDQAIHREAARALVPLLPEDSLDAVLAMLDRDALPEVRLLALETRLARRPDSAETRLLAALTDGSGRVRLFCQHYVRVRMGQDPAAAYRRGIVRGGANLAEALLGLGETGQESDAAQVRPFLSHSRPRVRAAAVGALDRLAKEPPLSAFLLALEEESPAVSRAARAALSRRASVVSLDALREMYRMTRHRHVRANVLALIARNSLWGAAPTLVAASAHAEEDLRAKGRGLLARWLLRSARGGTFPTPEQRDALDAALRAHGTGMDAAQREQMNFVLKTVVLGG